VYKVSISQQWAEEAEKDQGGTEIPPQFKKHTIIFSEEAAKQFPPS
jgi:hypothetical protein